MSDTSVCAIGGRKRRRKKKRMDTSGHVLGQYYCRKEKMKNARLPLPARSSATLRPGLCYLSQSSKVFSPSNSPDLLQEQSH
ncbi:uncharacterized protein LOC132251164 isoform X2 [Alligator mississippiensis]|uniref:uncharacterized protein LOC132251164 isoform X2 n=1 Tax=Alligator mississippiensis TaxID=8496 RepID=UPI002877F84B|nr:uncharacterized protein LOC132251164 isoform X2 [Alligator mississippiensis]